MLQLSVTAGLVSDGLALMVGLGGRLGVVCAGAVMDAGLTGMAVAHAKAAVERIIERAPRVVIVPVTLDRHERDGLLQACADVGAELVELSAVLEPSDVVHALAAAVARSECRRQRRSSAAIKVR